jgi:hypothetical protein
MSGQPELFHETLNDALREVIEALGGAKKVGPLMRPEKAVDASARWVLDCLNPDRDHRFDPDQVLWLLREGRRIGCHAVARFLMREGGYAEPVPLDPRDEADELRRKFIHAVEIQGQIANRLAKLGVV